MQTNLNIFDFKLSQDDMDAILKLDTGKSVFFDHHDPGDCQVVCGDGEIVIVLQYSAKLNGNQ